MRVYSDHRPIRAKLSFPRGKLHQKKKLHCDASKARPKKLQVWKLAQEQVQEDFNAEIGKLLSDAAPEGDANAELLSKAIYNAGLNVLGPVTKRSGDSDWKIENAMELTLLSNQKKAAHEKFIQSGNSVDKNQYKQVCKNVRKEKRRIMNT